MILSVCRFCSCSCFSSREMDSSSLWRDSLVLFRSPFRASLTTCISSSPSFFSAAHLRSFSSRIFRSCSARFSVSVWNICHNGGKICKLNALHKGFLFFLFSSSIISITTKESLNKGSESELERHCKSKTIKTWTACGNTHLACEEIGGT